MLAVHRVKAPIAAKDSIRLLRDAAVYAEMMFQILTVNLQEMASMTRLARRARSTQSNSIAIGVKPLHPRFQKYAFEFDPTRNSEPSAIDRAIAGAERHAESKGDIVFAERMDAVDRPASRLSQVQRQQSRT